MANALYDNGRNAFADGDLDWTNDIILAVLVDTDSYSVDLVNDDFLNVIPDIARMATALLTGKSSVAGVVDADDTTFVEVPITGKIGEAVVLCKYTGVDTTSLLVAYIDDAVNLPVTPKGGDIIAQWPNGIDKILKL